MFVGLISFLIVGTVAGLISLEINEGMILLLGLPIGSLLMLFILSKLDRDKILAVIIRSLLGGFAGFLSGFIIGELLVEVIGFIIPSLKNLEQVKAQIVPNIVALSIADAIYGIFIGHLLYGRKSIKFFALICAIASIPFGILVSMSIDVDWIDFEQNLLFMLVSFGTTTGLAIGFYSLLKRVKANKG
ncbi:hypothetical protein [Clostridium cellulovorans]|nr:hypothetical protein [Clostridium cellulovorans]